MKAQDLLLILDMGHGGSDPGASGNGVIEKVANYNTGMALKKYFESKGITVILTRLGDNTMSLAQRTTIANNEAKKYSKKKAIFISVHHNAGGGDRGEYIFSIYGGAGKEIAEAIGTELNTKLGQQKKCYSKKGTDNKDYYYVIKNTTMAAVIVEVAFLDNKLDVQICDTVSEQERNGRVIGDGILKWAGISISSNSSNSNTTVNSSEMYRIRKSWKDVASQKGAYKDKNNAITECKKYSDYNVYDSKGNTVFSNASSNFKVGDKVKIIGAVYVTGQPISNWAKTQILNIEKIQNNKALLQPINSWVYIKDLIH